MTIGVFVSLGNEEKAFGAEHGDHAGLHCIPEALADCQFGFNKINVGFQFTLVGGAAESALGHGRKTMADSRHRFVAWHIVIAPLLFVILHDWTTHRY